MKSRLLILCLVASGLCCVGIKRDINVKEKSGPQTNTYSFATAKDSADGTNCLIRAFQNGRDPKIFYRNGVLMCDGAVASELQYDIDKVREPKLKQQKQSIKKIASKKRS